MYTHFPPPVTVVGRLPRGYPGLTDPVALVRRTRPPALTVTVISLGIKNEAARMKVTPPLAVAPLAHGDDMRWNPNDNDIDFNP